MGWGRQPSSLEIAPKTFLLPNPPPPICTFRVIQILLSFLLLLLGNDMPLSGRSKGGNGEKREEVATNPILLGTLMTGLRRSLQKSPFLSCRSFVSSPPFKCLLEQKGVECWGETKMGEKNSGLALWVAVLLFFLSPKIFRGGNISGCFLPSGILAQGGKYPFQIHFPRKRKRIIGEEGERENSSPKADNVQIPSIFQGGNCVHSFEQV